MEERDVERLRAIVLMPYIYLATTLIGKPRECGGNMFRHQMDTLSILLDYGYFDNVLLKASVIHDLLEDNPSIDIHRITSLDDGPEVLALVREMTKAPGESKDVFLRRIRTRGSRHCKILKVADRISNMISLGLVNDMDFIKRYSLETAFLVYPIAEEVSEHMSRELRDLISSRMGLLGTGKWGY
jgi:(p)ppGpp synthase/HD superfamily hydrolase